MNCGGKVKGCTEMMNRQGSMAVLAQPLPNYTAILLEQLHDFLKTQNMSPSEIEKRLRNTASQFIQNGIQHNTRDNPKEVASAVLSIDSPLPKILTVPPRETANALGEIVWGDNVSEPIIDERSGQRYDRVFINFFGWYKWDERRSRYVRANMEMQEKSPEFLREKMMVDANWNRSKNKKSGEVVKNQFLHPTGGYAISTVGIKIPDSSPSNPSYLMFEWDKVGKCYRNGNSVITVGDIDDLKPIR